MATEPINDPRSTRLGEKLLTRRKTRGGAGPVYTWLTRLKLNLVADKSQIYRIGFHILLLPALFLLPVLVFPTILKGVDRNELITRLIIIGIALVPIYVANIVYFIPILLKPGRYAFYLLVLAISVLATYLIMSFLWGDFSFVDRLENEHSSTPRQPAGPFIFIALSISTIFELILNWERHKQHHEQTAKEKIQLELSFLKAQINPHFLFNTLNNIHSMAELKSDKTSDAILMLSDLLRYVLYGTSHGSVPIQTEIDSIENYIAIQRLRIPKRDSIRIRFDTTGHYGNTLIEPMLLLPFVENAFKHGISYQQRSEVLIDLQVASNQLDLRVHNTKKQVPALLDATEDRNAGIGLANIRRRLELLYPGKYALQIQNDIDTFDIHLTLHI